MYEMHVITEARPRRKSSVKMRCNMISTINSLFMLKKRNTEESMLQTALSSLLTPDRARKIALVMPPKTASESVMLASSTSAATTRCTPRSMTDT